jgi:O-antigen ligase
MPYRPWIELRLADQLANASWPGLLLLALLIAASAFGLGPLLLPLVAAAALVSVASPPSGLVLVAGLLPQRQLSVLQPPGAEIILLGSLAAGVILRAAPGWGRLRVSIGGIAAVGYVALTLMTIPPAVSGSGPDEIGPAIARFLHVAGALVLFLCARWIMQRHGTWRFIGVAGGSAALAAFVGIAGFFRVAAALQLQALLSSTADTFNRAVGTFSNPNYFGAFAALAAVMLVGLATAAPSRPGRLFFLAGAATCITGLALSLSRGGILSSLVGLLTLAFMRSRSFGIAVTIAVVAIGAVAYPLFLGARLEQTFGAATTDAYIQATQSEESRLSMIAGGLALWAAAPIFGVGFGRFQTLIPPFTSEVSLTYPHNWYVRVLAEQGVAGALVVGIIIVALLLALRRSQEPLRATALAMTFATLTFNLFGEPLLGLQSTGILWLVCAGALLPSAAIIPPRQEHKESRDGGTLLRRRLQSAGGGAAP